MRTPSRQEVCLEILRPSRSGSPWCCWGSMVLMGYLMVCVLRIKNIYHLLYTRGNSVWHNAQSKTQNKNYRPVVSAFNLPTSQWSKERIKPGRPNSSPKHTEFRHPECESNSRKMLTTCEAFHNPSQSEWQVTTFLSITITLSLSLSLSLSLAAYFIYFIIFHSYLFPAKFIIPNCLAAWVVSFIPNQSKGLLQRIWPCISLPSSSGKAPTICAAISCFLFPKGWSKELSELLPVLSQHHALVWHKHPAIQALVCLP